MSKLKKHSLLLVLIMLILICVPISFASDLNNATNGIDDSSESISENDEAWVDLEENSYNVDEDDSIEITGNVHIDIIDGSYPGELNIQCQYVDSNNITRNYIAEYDGYSFTFDTSIFEGLTPQNSPYILTFSAVKDELHTEFTEWYYIDEIAPATVSLVVNKVIELGPVAPAYETFTPNGKIYVAESGSDENTGFRKSKPLATIERALEVNEENGYGYEIIVSKGLYVITESCTLKGKVKITGDGEAEFINGGTDDGYMFFTLGDTLVELRNLIFSGGKSGAISGSTTIGGSGNANKVLNIINCTFADNSGYVGAITTYSKTTILSSTFINNKANGYTGYFRGIISARDNFLNVNFCTFIDNSLAADNPIVYSVDSVKTNANYNFWGTNDGPKSTDTVGKKVKTDKWIVISPKLSNESAIVGNTYDFNVKFLYTTSNSQLSEIKAQMPDLAINLKTETGKIDSTSVIKNNISTTNYKAILRGYDTVSVFIGNNFIESTTFFAEVPESDKIYVSPNGSDNDSGNQTNPLKTIQSAIDYNNALGGGKVIIVLPGSYVAHDLNITDEIIILGQENPVIDVNNIYVDADTYIYNLTFVNSKNTAIYHNSSDLSIFNSIFENNTDVIVSNSGKLLISNTKFSWNNGTVISTKAETTVEGSEFINNNGNILIESDASIIQNVFENNSGVNGGAIFVNATASTVKINSNRFSSNKANKGGAIFAAVAYACIIDNNVFEKNTADAIYFAQSKTLNNLENNIFADNGIFINSTSVDMLNNTMSGVEVPIKANNAIIGGIILTLNENNTIKLKNGEIKLNATVSDDMGNLIDGGVVKFTIDGTEIGSSNVVSGKAAISKELNTGDYLLSGSYSGSSILYPASDIRTSLVRINVVDNWFINETGFETLQEAVDAAGINDVIKGTSVIHYEPIIQIGHRTRPAEPWVINKNITITSLGDEAIVLNATDRYQFYIDYYSNVTFRNIIFTGSNNPNGWGGAIDSMGKNTIVVENCTFIDNIAEKGAAIFGYGNLFVKDSVFINNSATVFGGAIVKDGDGDFLIENCKFINNSAFTYAGAVDTRGYSDIKSVFKNITFEGNTATCGGAVFTNGYNVTFIDCVFNNNKAIDKGSNYDPLGGALYAHYGATVFKNVNFTNNFAEGSGGALQLENSVSSVVDSQGRHITIYWGILENCLIENNTALGYGGAIYTGISLRTYINITNSIIRNNTAKNAAVFANLYGFYTLNNVTAENNRNTIDDDEINALMYTLGMYSFPESYYSDITIFNSTFKNNDAKKVLMSYTIYSSVKLENNVFDGEGQILYVTDSDATLINNTELNPRNAIAIENDGMLALENNNFINPIKNTRIIKTPTYIVVLDNKTIDGEIDDTIELVSRLTDDNNNTIIGGDVVFVVGDSQIPAILKNDKYVANYTIVSGNQYIGAVYNSTGLLNITARNATIIGKSTLIIIAPDAVYYYKNCKYNITLINSKNNPISDIVLSVLIGNTEYNVDVDANGVALIDLSLNYGEYDVLTKFDGNSRYSPINVSSKITINPSIVNTSGLKRAYNTDYDFKVTFLAKDGSPLSNRNVSFTINGEKQIVTTDLNGTAILTNLNVGTYDVVTSNPETSDEAIFKLSIVKRITENKNLVMDYRDGSKFKVRIVDDDGSFVGAGEIVTLKLGGKTYGIKTDKNGYASMTINNQPKAYTITAEYKGYKISNKVTVKQVIKASNLSKKKAKTIKYTASLKTSKGKAISGKKLIFKIKGKTYTAKTNSKGVATVSLMNLNVGKHTILIKYAATSVKKTITIKK
ncbi:MAG: hypothetical protein IJF83_09045 [Methanobrevibacter sp.]|nr:hypothetical protein [Methanobrevibacter sp.]